MMYSIVKWHYVHSHWAEPVKARACQGNSLVKTEDISNCWVFTLLVRNDSFLFNTPPPPPPPPPSPPPCSSLSLSSQECLWLVVSGGSLLLLWVEFPLCPSIRARLEFLPCLHVTGPQIEAEARHMETDVTLLTTDSQARNAVCLLIAT